MLGLFGAVIAYRVAAGRRPKRTLADEVRFAPSIGATHAILAEHQAELTPRAYGVLLSTLRKEKDWRASARTVSWARKNDASKLNAQHFTLAISACARSRQWRAALDLLRLAGSAADVVCFNAALAACASAGRGRAWPLFDLTPRAAYAGLRRCTRSADRCATP